MNVFNKLFVFRIEIYIYITKASANLTPITVNKEVNGAKNVFLYTVSICWFSFGTAISTSSRQKSIRRTQIQKIPFGEQTSLTNFIILNFQPLSHLFSKRMHILALTIDSINSFYKKIRKIF